MLLPCIAFVCLLFALVGLFVGCFFSTLAVQRSMQRHIHLLQMRCETQRVVVVDLTAPAPWPAPSLVEDKGEV